MSTIREAVGMSSASEKESCVRWSSIFAGVLAALVIGLLFNLLGAAIGLSVFLPKSEVLRPLGFGTIIWFVLTGIVSMYVGGWFSGRFSNAETMGSGILYGMAVSGLSVLLSLAVMASTVGFILNSSFSALGSIISASSSVVLESPSLVEKGVGKLSQISPDLSNKVKRAMPNLKPVVDKINEKAMALLPKENTPEEIKRQLEKLIRDYLNSSEDLNNDEIENKVVDKLAEITEKDPEEIKNAVQDWKKMYLEAKEKAYTLTLETSKKVTDVLSQIAWVNFFILLSGVAAAIAGAMSGISNKY